MSVTAMPQGVVCDNTCKNGGCEIDGWAPGRWHTSPCLNNAWNASPGRYIYSRVIQCDIKHVNLKIIDPVADSEEVMIQTRCHLATSAMRSNMCRWGKRVPDLWNRLPDTPSLKKMASNTVDDSIEQYWTPLVRVYHTLGSWSWRFKTETTKHLTSGNSLSCRVAMWLKPSKFRNCRIWS